MWIETQSENNNQINMEKELKIILKEELEVLSKQAYESAKNKGFYPKDVNTAFLQMFIIV